MGTHLRVALSLLVSLAVAAIAACGGSDDSANEEADGEVEPTQVTFALSVPVPDAGQVFAYVPEQAGFFAEEGLEVDVKTNDGSTAALQQVASGRADFAIASPNNFFAAVDEGLDLRAVALLITHSIYEIFVPEDSEIESYADLDGGTIGTSSPQSFAFQYAQEALRSAGVDPDDVEMVSVGTGAAAYEALESGRVDALSLWDTQLAQFEAELGADLRALPDTELSEFPGDALLTNSKFLEENPDVVTRFARAVFKGIVFAMANPTEAAEMYLAEFPDAARGASVDGVQAVMESRLANMELREDQENWGDIPYESFERMQDVQLKLGVQKNPIEIREIMTDQLLPEIQDFDEEEAKKGSAGSS